MRISMLKSLTVVSLVLTATPLVAATSRSNQSVGQVQIDNRQCLFFNLKNVAEADPAVPGSIWFAVPTTGANYQTFASILLSAKMSGQPLQVSTDGTVSCGYATANVLAFN